MKKIALIAAVAASFAAPAFAQSALDLAVANHNMSVESTGDRINPVVLGTTVSSSGSSALAQAVAFHNASADSVGDRIDGSSVTTFSNTPAYAQDIFARLAAESREDN